MMPKFDYFSFFFLVKAAEEPDCNAIRSSIRFIIFVSIKNYNFDFIIKILFRIVSIF